MPTALNPAQWYRELARFPQAGFCHTPAWGRLIREVWGGEVEAVLHPTPDGGQALVPLVRRRLAHGLLPWTVSGETGVYGGPLLEHDLSPGDWQRFWADLHASYGSMTLFLPPGAPWQAPSRGEVIEHQTHRLDLTAGEYRQGYNRGLKAHLNKARRAGLTVRAGSGPADVTAYWELYRQTLARWGARTSWVRPQSFFAALLGHGHPEVRLYLAYEGERVLSGIWVATFGGEALYLAGSTAEAGLSLGASQLLLDHALGVAQAEGVREFDFGASGGREGLIRFKTGFGAQPVPYAEVRLWAPPVRLYWWWKQRRQPAVSSEEVTC